MEPFVAGVRAVHALYVAFMVTAPALRWSGVLLASRRLTAPGLGRLHLACLGVTGQHFGARAKTLSVE